MLGGDEEKQKRDGNKPSAVPLAKDPQAFGNPQDDELKRGAKKDKSNDTEMELEEAISLAKLAIRKAARGGKEELIMEKSRDNYSYVEWLMSP